MAASRRPATQMGGGDCTGGGSIETSFSVLNRPAYDTSRPVQRRRMTSRASLVRAPRSLTGTPHASNSFGNSPPTPAPNRYRTPDATTSAAPILAASAAG